MVQHASVAGASMVQHDFHHHHECCRQWPRCLCIASCTTRAATLTCVEIPTWSLPFFWYSLIVSLLVRRASLCKHGLLSSIQGFLSPQCSKWDTEVRHLVTTLTYLVLTYLLVCLWASSLRAPTNKRLWALVAYTTRQANCAIKTTPTRKMSAPESSHSPTQ